MAAARPIHSGMVGIERRNSMKRWMIVSVVPPTIPETPPMAMPSTRPGKSDESLIAEAISGRDGWKMPPEGEGTPLTAEEIKAVAAWIEQGAVGPADEGASVFPAFESPLPVSHGATSHDEAAAHHFEAESDDD